jgi:hypothetical protein
MGRARTCVVRDPDGNPAVRRARRVTRVASAAVAQHPAHPGDEVSGDAFTRVGNLFRPRRHLLSAGAYRATMRERAATWRAVAGLPAA